ncbi:UNVERIFIED_CONTAM: Homocysteine S-methyltransferase 2 [Sesamum latifolium]|uniref:Homocysteine S-methyltransferase 2 n=1 Tax=Sesamum latifolium TaxID=2727402 RepID=A0AAW2XSM8_9LAMI
MVLETVVDHHPNSSFMTSFLRQCGGYAVIDGLATELERHGADLNDPLWSAKCLINSPHLIRSKLYMQASSANMNVACKQVHLDYLEAGANIIISASYQATLQGFEAKGLSRKEGEALLEKSVKIACEARDIYYDRATKGSWDISGDVLTRQQHPVLVAASVGSYGAYLADGSEYSGIYGDNIGLETLKDFHRRRVQVLAESGADLIAFETIPNKLEAKAYAELLEEEAVNIPAWFSFSSKDGINAVSGDPIQDCALIADSCEQVVAVGVNCTPPRFIHGLIQSIQTVTAKPILVYPNSGETYDASRKEWVFTKHGLMGDAAVLTKLIDKYSQMGSSESLEYAQKAFKIFKNIRDCRSSIIYLYNSLIRGSSSVGAFDEAVLLYVDMLFEGVAPDNYTYPFVLSACAKGLRLSEGVQLHGSVVKMGFHSDIFVLNSLIYCYGECGEIDRARKVFDEMCERNVVSWTSLICGYARRERHKEAVSLFFKMVEEGN